MNDALIRCVVAMQVQNAVDDVDLYVTDQPVTDKDIANLIDYAKKTGSPCPDIPDDEPRRSDVIKTYVRYWTVRETLSCMVKLTGGTDDPTCNGVSVISGEGSE
jgi:hypothetical protein